MSSSSSRQEEVLWCFRPWLCLPLSSHFHLVSSNTNSLSTLFSYTTILMLLFERFFFGMPWYAHPNFHQDFLYF